MLKSILILSLFTLTAASLVKTTEQQVGVRKHEKPLIVGGKNAKRGSYKNVIMLEVLSKQDVATCVGALISPEWILTAAHCIAEQHNKVMAKWGHLKINKMKKMKVKEEIFHPKYKANSIGDYDIALLRLPKQIKRVKPIKLYKGEIKADTLSTTIGWGSLKEGGKASKILKEVDITIGSAKTCRDNGNGQWRLYVCAGGNEVGKDSCTGDSGGPLLLRPSPEEEHIAVGVLSHSLGACAKKNTWAYYSKTSKFLDWIEETTGLSQANFTYTGVADWAAPELVAKAVSLIDSSSREGSGEGSGEGSVEGLEGLYKMYDNYKDEYNSVTAESNKFDNDWDSWYDDSVTDSWYGR